MTPQLIRLTALLAASFGSFLSAGTAWAQNAEPAKTQLDRVEITGSNIKRVDAETAASVTIIKREDIEKSGKQTLSEVIRALPVDNNGSVGTSFSGGFAAGGSGVSMRGLGVSSTLVLVNGRRMAPYGLGDDGQRSFVDLSSIPLDAVERVEVLKDGASAIYGSDAIAGVVNIILRRDFTGVATSVSTGMSRYKDGNTTRASVTAGTGNLIEDKYNVFVNFEASKQEAIWQRDRGDRKWIGSGDLRPYGYAFDAGHLAGWFQNTDPGTPPQVSPNPWGAVRDPVTLQYTQLPGCTSTIPTEPGYGGCAFSLTDYAQITPSQEKVNLFVRGSLAGSEAFMPFVEAGLFNSKLASSSTPTSVSSSWPDAVGNQTRTNTNIQLPANHPDNPLGVSGRLRYLMADVGPRVNEFDTTVFRTLLGGKGSVAGWDYDSGFLYTQSETERVAKGYVRDSVLKEVLAGTGPLGFYRLGANAHLNSSAMYAALSPTLETKTKTTVSSLDAKASRELMELTGGALGIAVGAEARRETTDSPAIPFTREADIVGLGFSEFSGRRNVLAAYTELSAPLTKTLEVNAAARVDRYSDVGNSFTPKFGAKWKALPTLALRGNFAAGFRAPGPAENGNSSNGAFSNFVDPVRCNAPEPDGGGTPADCGSGTTVVISVGNPNIKPEKSRSTSLGLVFEPAPGTSVTVDFWDIQRRNEITGADVSLILANPAAFPGSKIVRDDNDLNNLPGSGTVLAVSAPYVNLSKTRTNGVDLDLRHALRAGELGRFTSSLILTYVNSFERTLPDGTKLEYVGTHGPTVLSSNSGAPRTRAILGLDWSRDTFSLATQVNYVSGIRNVEYQGDPNGCLNHHADDSDAPGGCRIASFTTVDLYGKYALRNGLELFGSVQNLFDRIAPLDPQTYGAIHYNTTYHLSGAIGRFFTVGLKYRWM